MELELTWPWLALLALGAFHGVNPGMGWLFAVALGLQERKRVAVWRSLGPLALGHALAVAVALLAMVLMGRLVPLGVLKWGVAAILLGFGLFHLVRHRHPRYGGMRVGARDLTVWSFLMASAHGAGLMVLPFVFGTGVLGGRDHAAMDHAHHASMAGMDAAPAGHAGHTALLAGLPPEPVVGLLTGPQNLYHRL